MCQRRYGNMKEYQMEQTPPKRATIPGGYYLKARVIQESDVAHAAPAVREIWDLLISRANHKPKKVGGIFIERGQRLCNYVYIRDALMWRCGGSERRYSKHQVKRALRWLKDRGMITTSKAPGGLLVTISNYEYYQNHKNYERHDYGSYTPRKGSEHHPDRHTERHAAKGGKLSPNATPNATRTPLERHEPATQENNNEKNERDTSGQIEEWFEEIWSRYPSRVKRKEALRHFGASVKTEKDWADINTALDHYLAHLEANTWKRPQNGSTWFNNWTDWLDYEEPGRGGEEAEADSIARREAEEALEVEERVSDLLTIQKEDPERCRRKLNSIGDTARARKIKALFEQKVKVGESVEALS